MYVVFNAETTKAVMDKHGFSIKTFKTEGAAKAAITRLKNKGDTTNYDFACWEFYKSDVEAEVKRTNMMSGETFWESINTNYRCSPSSETYWSS